LWNLSTPPSTTLAEVWTDWERASIRSEGIALVESVTGNQ
jgi:hypothetical protein